MFNYKYSVNGTRSVTRFGEFVIGKLQESLSDYVHDEVSDSDSHSPTPYVRVLPYLIYLSFCLGSHPILRKRRKDTINNTLSF